MFSVTRALALIGACLICGCASRGITEVRGQAVAPRGLKPIIIVSGMPEGGTAWQAIDNLAAIGYPRELLHAVRYDPRANWAEAARQIAEEARHIALQYADENQRFDWLTHSLGQFLSLYAIAHHDLSPRVGRVIGIAGLAHGVDQYILPSTTGLVEDEGESIKALRRRSDGSLSPPLAAFYKEYGTIIARLDKCSVYSPDDDVLRPSDSGVFEGSQGQAIPLMRHAWGFKDRRFLRLALESCLDKRTLARLAHLEGTLSHGH
jgi:hypothetical protein